MRLSNTQAKALSELVLWTGELDELGRTLSNYRSATVQRLVSRGLIEVHGEYPAMSIWSPPHKYYVITELGLMALRSTGWKPTRELSVAGT
jgi:hypothetical protein